MPYFSEECLEATVSAIAAADDKIRVYHCAKLTGRREDLHDAKPDVAAWWWRDKWAE